MTLSGALRFGRYSFPPNRLGFCGPPDHGALLEYVSSGEVDKGLLDLARRFEGAYPYLMLIAHANNIADPFDDRVVEAYWLGNRCLERVDGATFYEFLGDQFKPKMTANDFRWLGTKLDQGAPPHHNFHVFDIYTRAGLMRDNKADIAVTAMDSCRISWATVSCTDGDELVVDRPALVLADGKLALSEPRTVRVTRQVDRRGFVEGIGPGDHISVHWQWACEKLSPLGLSSLQAFTARCVALANETM